MTRQELLNWLLPVAWELADVPDGHPDGSPVMSRILAARGFGTAEQRDQLFHAPFESLPDPFLFRSMEDACRLIEAHLANERPRFLIFGDYDADGLTAAALLSRYLAGLGHQPDILIPDRFDDGYGLSPALVDEIELHRPDLVITVDTGTSSPDLVRDLRGRGMDVVITDHHQATGGGDGSGVPVINPTLAGETYPFPYLSGAGVALMLTLALDERRGKRAKIRPALIVLAAVGTVADVMPLVDVNRIIVREGLRFFPDHAPQGLKAIERMARAGNDLTARDIAFSLAPRLNAAGRMGDVRLALDLLLEDDPVRADRLGVELDALNQKRRQVEQETFSQALDAVLDTCGDDPPAVAIAVGKGWHAGVMGIVSSRLVEKFRVPAITLNEEDGLLTGSARSYGDIDLIQVIHTAEPLLEKYGGHAGAAGLTLRMENLDAFCRQIRGVIEAIPARLRRKIHRADSMLAGSEVEKDLVKDFDAFEPTGTGFERPVVWMEDLTIEAVTHLGEGRHLKLSLRTPDPSMRVFDALMFGRGSENLLYAIGDTVEILAVPEINRWRDRETVQMRVIDVRPGRHDQANERAVNAFSAWVRGEGGRVAAIAGMAGLSLQPGLFASLWHLLESLVRGDRGRLAFLPVRLAWLLSHRYNEKADALEVLLALAIFDEANLVRLTSQGDGSFTCEKLKQKGNRPALSDSPLWAELKGLGVIVE